MKAKVFLPLIWVLLLTLGMAACKKDNAPKPTPVEDPYTPITEGNVFLPVLVHQPDMDKVVETEKSRGGTLVEKLAPDAERDYTLYRFQYKDMSIREACYRIHPKTGVLLQVSMYFPKKKATLGKCRTLLAKHGFDNSLILAKRHNGLARDKGALFLFMEGEYKGETHLIFRQFGAQLSEMPTIAKLPDEEYGDVLGNKFYSSTKIKQREIGAGNTLKEEKEVTYGKHKGKVWYALFSLKDAEAPMSFREYFFDWEEDTPDEQLGQCHKIIFIYEEPSLGYYTDNIRKVILPTREFHALCQQAGYEWFRPVGQVGDSFLNTNKNLQLVSRKIQFDDISPNDIFAINLFQNADNKRMTTDTHSALCIDDK